MFCPRCGAEQPAFARFCERCGQRLDPDDAPTMAAAAPAPVARQRPKRDPRLIRGAVAAAVVVLAVAVLALTGAFGSDDSAKRAVAPTSTAMPSTPATAPPTTTTQAPATNPETETDTDAESPVPQPVRGTVKRTCGRNGVGGDCHLSVRARPSTTAAEVKRLDEGDSLRLTCQVRGDSVFSSALGDSSTVWSRTTGGGYVSNVYVVGPRVSARRMTLPRC